MAVMSTITSAPVISLVAVAESDVIADADSGSHSPVLPTNLKIEVDVANNLNDPNTLSLFSPGDIPYDTTCPEPFPEYEELEKQHDSPNTAYDAAMHATIQDTIRMETVDPNITVTTQLSGKKEQTFAAMKEILSHPQLHESSRERFIALTNMVILLDEMIFPATIGEPLDIQTTNEASQIAKEIFRFALMVDDMMQDLVVDAGNVYYELSLIVEDDQLPEYKTKEYMRYVHMSQLVATLKKPRRIEEKALILFSDLYHEWIYTKYRKLRDIKVTATKDLDTDHLDLTRGIHAVLCTLNRSMEGYNIYRGMLNQIKKKYFAEVIERIDTTYGAVARCFQEDDSD